MIDSMLEAYCYFVKVKQTTHRDIKLANLFLDQN